MSNPDPAEITQYKERIAGLFSRAAPTYDQAGPQFFSHFGKRLVQLAKIPIGCRVLDVATGRGAVLFPVADVIGPQGEVIGIDISEAMLKEARTDIEKKGLKNALVCQMDAEQLQFSDASFDYVLCGLSVFIFPLPLLALSEMWRVLKPGGVLGMSTFWRDDERWSWLGELFEKHLPPTTSVESTTDEEQPPAPDFRSHNGLKELMDSAGFTGVQVIGEEKDFVYATEESWWSTIWSHGMRGTLERIQSTSGTDGLENFKTEAFKHIQTVRHPDGFNHMWSVLFTLATKPYV